MRKYVIILILFCSCLIQAQDGLQVTTTTTPYSYTLDGDFSYDVCHMFAYFGDSAISFSYTSDWQHLTNATDSMFIYQEIDGFSVSNDTITILRAGDYDMTAKFAMDGDNLETQSVRFYNVTQAKGVPVAGAITTRSAGNFSSLPVMGYAENVAANDKFVIQIKSDAAGGTAVFKNGIIRIVKLHN